MTNVNVDSAIGLCWEVLGLIWLIGLAFTKRTVRAQPNLPRLFHVTLVLVGFFLLCTDWFGKGWLGLQFEHETRWLQLSGLALTAAGCLFAIWARVTLGTNWSGRATVKAGHELVTTGPYSLSRHPIYTGLLAGGVGTALAEGVWRCVLGLVLILLGFAIKMSQEERLMTETFPEAYPLYRRRVKALIPGIL